MTISSDKDGTTKANILNATFELFKKEGLGKLTLRKIAIEANVNLALINYYFGSKDKLINETLKEILVSFQEVFATLDDSSLEPIQKLKTFLYQYTTSIMKYPELMRETLGKGDIKFDSQLEYKNFMKTLGINKIKQTVQEITGIEDDNQITMMVMQIHAAIFYPTLMTCKKEGVFIENPLSLEEQIDHFLQLYFAKYL